MSNDSDILRRTRSGRPIVRRADSPYDDYRSPSPSKKRHARALKPKAEVPQLTGPLSVVTAHMDVPVRDMQAWVNRSLEERKAEVFKKKGHVTRPMNSFMLYRSAYSQRTKAWCTANNHQVVSSVSGASWPMEPETIRSFYNDLSKIEREKHSAAFPNYKFQPAKPGHKRSASTQDPDSEVGGYGTDPDCDWGDAHSVRKSRTRRSEYSHSPMPERSSPSPAPSQLDQEYFPIPSPYNHSRASSAHYQSARTMYPEAQHHLLRYQTSHPQLHLSQHQVQELPYNYNQNSHYHQQQSMYQSAMEEESGGVVGLPGANQDLDVFNFSDGHLEIPEPSAIDPILQSFGTNTSQAPVPHDDGLPFEFYSSWYASNQETQFSLAAIPQPEEQLYVPQQWEPENNLPVLEHISEFEHYLAESLQVNGTTGERRPSEIRSVIGLPPNLRITTTGLESRRSSIADLLRISTPVQNVA